VILDKTFLIAPVRALHTDTAIIKVRAICGAKRMLNLNSKFHNIKKWDRVID